MTYWHLRDAGPDDARYVQETWLTSYLPSHYTTRHRLGEYLCKLNRRLGARVKHAYFEAHRPLVSELLDRSRVVIACFDEAPEVVCGWAAGERFDGVRVVHYVYTKAALRQQGIGKAAVARLCEVLGSGDIIRSHDTRMGRYSTVASRWPLVPYIAFKETPTDATQVRMARAPSAAPG